MGFVDVVQIVMWSLMADVWVALVNLIQSNQHLG